MIDLDKWGLSLAVFLPLVGALLIAVTPKTREDVIHFLSGLFTGLPLAIVIGVALTFDYHSGAMQFQVDASWIPSIGARYHVGIDGIALAMFVLTFLVTFLCFVYS